MRKALGQIVALSIIALLYSVSRVTVIGAVFLVSSVLPVGEGPHSGWLFGPLLIAVWVFWGGLVGWAVHQKTGLGVVGGALVGLGATAFDAYLRTP